MITRAHTNRYCCPSDWALPALSRLHLHSTVPIRNTCVRPTTDRHRLFRIRRHRSHARTHIQAHAHQPASSRSCVFHWKMLVSPVQAVRHQRCRHLALSHSGALLTPMRGSCSVANQHTHTRTLHRMPYSRENSRSHAVNGSGPRASVPVQIADSRTRVSLVRGNSQTTRSQHVFFSVRACACVRVC